MTLSSRSVLIWWAFLFGQQYTCRIKLRGSK